MLNKGIMISILCLKCPTIASNALIYLTMFFPYVLPCPTFPYTFIPCLTLPNNALLCLTMLYQAIQFLNINYCTVPCITVPCNALPLLHYCALTCLPCLNMPYHA